MRIREATAEDSAIITERSNEAAQEFYRQHGFSHEAVLFELEFGENGG
jgi:ribosomal protein S18 acetylase RimI-like enzyme